MDEMRHGFALRSLVTDENQLRLSRAPIDVGEPGPDEIVVRIEAAPINPSDLGTLLGPIEPATLRSEGDVLVADIPPDRMPALRARIGEALPVGNEGAGTVVRAGADAAHLLGRKVAVLGGGTYATLRKLAARDATLLPDGASAADGAALFVNPRTALGFVETMRAEGHKAIVHSAAASNLGQMLARICVADGIPLVCIVRSDAHATLLRTIGVQHIVDNSRPDFDTALADAIADTGATIGFDAIGGGRMASRMIAAMEVAASRKSGAYNRYGSGVMKQLYIYGTLDPGPTLLDRVGYAWKLDGWLLTQFMQAASAETLARHRQRIEDELTTTFASRYTATISLAEALRPEIAAGYERKGTGAKYLIDPSR